MRFHWRFAVLGVLLLGPPLAYACLGGYWLYQHGWGFWAFSIWLACGVLFGLLSARWTKARQSVLPPIDWDAPRTFSPHDRKAWELVQTEAELADTVEMTRLSTSDLYIDVGKRLAERLAAHYQPLSTNPVDHVPLTEVMSALELAAEDLNHLCREIPGGDMITPAHLKRAVQAANYLSKANEIYGYLLPFVQPVSGLMRLGTQKLMVQPAWKNMQQNVLRWFFRAYVNRLGTHLIELFSGRLSIGADQYRRLTRHASERRQWSGQEGPETLEVAVTGARDAGKSALIHALDAAREGDLHTVKLRLEQGGFDEGLADHLKNAQLVETDSFTIHEKEVARDRYTRKDAVADSVECDLLLLVVDGRRSEFSPESRFAEAWLNWFDRNAGLEIPPALVVMTGIDRPEMGASDAEPAGAESTEGSTSTRARLSKSAREAVVAKKVQALRSALPPAFTDIVPVGLGPAPVGIEDRLLPELAALLHRAERTSLIRHFHSHSTRSKARRFFTQVGKQGRKLFQTVRTRGRQGS